MTATTDLDLRWVNHAHRRQLEAGRLKLPHDTQRGHPKVLVSVPEHLGDSWLAWIDRDMAELIWRLNHQHDVETLECCQGDAGQPAYLAFPNGRHRDRFLALAGDALRGEQHYHGGLRVRCVEFPHNQVQRVTKAVRNT